jgi:hypothetical protein
MPETRLPRRTARSSARRKVVAVLAIAVAWLMLLGILSAHNVSASPLLPATAATTDTPTQTDTPTDTPTTSAPTPTNTPHGRPSPTASTTGTTTATVAPTATTSGGGGVSTDPNDPGGGSSQATKVVLAQPTYAGAAGTSDSGISVASFGSNGLLFASLMSCIVGLLGIVVAVIAFRILRRDGYGPFLRALLLGKRASNQPSAKGAVAASGAGNVRRNVWSTRAADDYAGDSAERDSFSGYGLRAPPSSGGRRPPGPNTPRGRSSRPDW